MIFDDHAMHQIFAEVWRDMRLAYAWPLHHHPLPGHSSAALGLHPPVPVARSWLGVGVPTPTTLPHTHSLTEGLTVRLPKTLALPALALAVIAAGLTIGTALPDEIRGVGAPTPTAVPFTLPAPLAAAASCVEDEPCWNCETMGDLICGNLTQAQQEAGWAVFDAAGGAAQLLVNPHARVTLTGYSLTSPYDQGAPALGVNQLALDGAGVWFVFTANTL